MPEQIEIEARNLGWVPMEEFRGEEDKWVDAETFVDKGKHIMPILQNNNKRLQSEMNALRASQQKTEAALASAQEALAAMEEQHTVQTQKAVEAARKEVKAQLALASENGDHASVAELTDQLSQMPVEAPKPKAAPAPVAEIPPEFLAWKAENAWFEVDPVRTALANGIGVKLRQENSPLVGRPFWDEVAKEVSRVMDREDRPADDKVAGSRSSGRVGAGGKSYADLPKEAKDACDADLRAKVGEGKRYKTAADWRARYSEIYFSEEN